MNNKTNISIRKTLRAIMMFVMMLLGGTINTWAQEEKVLYSTNFQEWDNIKASSTDTNVDKKTTDGQTLTFSLCQSRLDNKGTDTKFTSACITLGYIRGEKKPDAYIKTSTLKSVTKVKFVHAATGNNRGWGLKVKGDGDADWVIVSSAVAKPSSGQEVTVDVNRKNVQLWFYNLDSKNYAFMTSLEISGIVEAAQEINISYYDTDGTTLIGKDVVPGNSELKYKYGAADVTTGSNVFRGWFDGTDYFATKVYEGTKLLSDLSLYAKATPKEEAVFGTEYTYDMTKEYWYPEDHELIDINGGAYEDQKHGWLFSADGTIKLHVASTAQIDLTLCNQSQNGTITVTDESGSVVSSFPAKTSDDATVQQISYSGSQTTLTLSIPAGTYIHGLTLFNYKPVYVSFKFPNDKTEGKCPDMIKASSTNEVTMPDNTLFSRLGWTFQGWTDGTNVYEGGKTYVINESVTLTPKVTENKYALTDTNTPVSVTWPLDHRKAPAINMSNSTTIFVYNTITAVEGEKQDIALKIDASNGKVVNTDSRINDLSNGAEGAQVNTGTIFNVPAVYGMTVIIHASDKVDTEGGTQAHFGSSDTDSKISLSDYTIPAEDQTISDNGKTLSIIYRGDATSININFDWAGTTSRYGFYKDITVVYPVLPFIYAENVIEDADPTKYPNEKTENAGTVDFKSDQSYPNTGNRHKKGDVVTVVATPEYGYNVKGYRVKGTTDLLPTKEITSEAGTTLLATDYTVGDGITYIEAIYTRKTLHKVTVKASNTELGSVSLKPIVENFYNEIREQGEDGKQGKLLSIESWFTENTEVTASADPAAECVVDYWTEDESTTHLTEANSYTFTTGSTDKTIIVHLKQGEIGSVIFDTSAAHVNGESVASLHRGALSIALDPINNVRSFTVPTNYTFFKSVDDNDVNTANAYHLLYWIDKADNDNRYELGKTYSFKTRKTITLTPVFTANPTTRTNRVNNPLVRYDFGTKVYSYYDSSSKETRNTCAPTVNIGNNTDTYWTAQAYFEVLTNGVVTPHTRDVTMYVNTGSRGYIRNEDLGDWCAFGPGTTFWCTSSVGTTVSIMSYSKITTTTIDGVVPTLDEKRTAEERERVGNDHAYVYSYTTHNSATTMPIVIGDDYSYYQWIEVQMLAANMVNQYTSVDDELHGKINNVESLSDFGAVEQEDGSVSFRSGDRIKISFERLFGFEFDSFVEPGRPDDDGNPTVLFKMNDDGTVDMVDNYYVMQHNIPRNADGTWGKASGEGKTVFTLKAIEPTAKEAADGKRTRYELEYDITSSHEMEIVFKEKPTFYVTYNPGSFASGLPPVAQWMEEGDKYTIPRNVSLYYEGNTLDHWVDEDYSESMTDAEKLQHTFLIGSEYSALAKNVQMFPVFYPNEFSILDLDEPATSTWHFTKKDGAPSINYERTRGILVTQLNKGDKKIDLKIDLDGTAFIGEDGKSKGNGKFNNLNSNERIQVNKWSKIYFPATQDCVVKVTSASGDPSNMMVAGKKKGDAGYNSISANAMEVTCPGDSATHLAVMLGDNTYLVDFIITYKPQDEANKAVIETLSCDNVTLDATEIKRQIARDGHVTFTVSPWLNDDKIPAVTGTATNGGTVTAGEATVFTKETVATVRTAVGVITESYPVQFEFATPEDYPKFLKITVNGTEYTETDNVVQDVPQSGIIKVLFNRNMAEATFDIPELQLTSTASAGKELEFKYWDLPEGGTIQLNITPDLKIFKDIYGKVCQQTLTLTLHIMKSQGTYSHSAFDFVVGKDGTISDAINAANSSTKPDTERYYIFVPDGEYHLTGNDPIAELGNLENERTTIRRAKVSLIGQSKSGTTLWNKPTQEGIGYTATIHTGKNTTEFYSQDITLENRLDYWGAVGGGAGRAVAFWDQGNKSIMKNVALMSWQDTYYSNNSNADYRGYFETCDIAGVVDFLCGDGNIWLEKCNLLLRDRTGNNIAAPGTQASQQWGYVLNNCTIRPETEHPQQLKGNDWTLGRTWNNSPAITYLNTKMVTQPTSDAWGRMGDGGQVVRFHEYRSMNGDGTALLNLGTRSLAACIPGVGSDNCVLNAEQAAQYTLRNVVGGTDAFEPNELCRQIDAASSAVDDRDENNVIWQDNIEVDDDQLRWDTDERALCYFVFKYEDGKWKYILNTANNYANILEYGTGYYCVRAANQRGGLGAATESVQYELRDPYELQIKQLADLEVEGVPYGWSTICLPFNARVPEGVTVYAATAHDKTSAEDKVEDFIMTLTPVEIIDSLKGYVVYGPAGQHYFSPTSRKCDRETILTGNPTETPISTVNNNGYVLSNKSWGLGFYKYSGTTYAPYKAWLPESMVTDAVSEALASGTRMIRLLIDDTNDIRLPMGWMRKSDGKVYDLSGKRIHTEAPQGVYIVNGKKMAK